MKKLINNREDVLVEQLRGFWAAYPEMVDVHFDPAYITRSYPKDNGTVAIVSGGGSGHEPLHGGYVGIGMLDAACPGQVFTSPTPDQMYEAGIAMHRGSGVLNIVKNYTGDVLNFQMAADMLRNEGIEVLNIVIDDDVAVKDSLYTAGRRGLGTTIVCEKVCGAAAEEGMSLRDIADLCRQVNLNGKSMGMALTSCTTPAKGSPIFDLGDDEIEIGVGIHGEPGTQRTKIMSANKIAAILVNTIFDDGAYRRSLPEWDGAKKEWVDVEVQDVPFGSGDQVIAIVNGMGGTPLSELYTIYGKLHEIVRQRNIIIVRKLVGNWITSLDMKGVSITLVRSEGDILKYWDAPVRTPALTWGI